MFTPNIKYIKLYNVKILRVFYKEWIDTSHLEDNQAKDTFFLPSPDFAVLDVERCDVDVEDDLDFDVKDDLDLGLKLLDFDVEGDLDLKPPLGFTIDEDFFLSASNFR